MQNVNVVVVTGNLTRDPELRSTTGGTSVCEMRLAVNGRRRNGNGEWVDKPNFFTVVVFGASGERCATYLSRGRPVAVEGRLDWREWETDDGPKRQAVQIIANIVQFLGQKGEGGNGDGAHRQDGDPAGPVPGEVLDFHPVPAGGSEIVGPGGRQEEDDIPF